MNKPKKQIGKPAVIQLCYAPGNGNDTNFFSAGHPIDLAALLVAGARINPKFRQALLKAATFALGESNHDDV